MDKIKIFTIYTKSYAQFLNFFLSSIKRFEKDFNVIPIECIENEGDFLGPEYKNIIIFKIEQIIRTISENIGDIIIWSDCDILFLDNPLQDILKTMNRVLVGGLKEGKRFTKDMLNGGFIAIKCSEKTIAIFKRLLFLTVIYRKTEMKCLYEQELLNYLLQNENIPYKSFPNTFQTILYGREVKNKEQIKVAHFVSGKEEDHVGIKLKMMNLYSKENNIQLEKYELV